MIASLVFAIVGYQLFFEIRGKTLFNSFLISSGRCEYHCCAGPIRAVCMMAILFRILVSYGESVCSGAAVNTMFAVIAFKKSSVL